MKQDSIDKNFAAVQAAQSDAIKNGLGQAYDDGALDQKASDGTLSQADLDKAVADAKAVDAQALADAKTASDAAMVEAQKQISDLQSKLGLDDAALAAVQSSMQAIQDASAKLLALFPSQPASA